MDSILSNKNKVLLTLLSIKGPSFKFSCLRFTLTVKFLRRKTVRVKTSARITASCFRKENEGIGEYMFAKMLYLADKAHGGFKIFYCGKIIWQNFPFLPFLTVQFTSINGIYKNV